VKKIIVLGSGMVGSAIALDLHKRHSVTATDFNQQALDALKLRDNIATMRLDCSDHHALKKAVSGFDLAVCAVPGFLGFKTLKALIEAQIDVVDISFFPEDALELNALAIEKDVTVVVDIGVAPGLDNLILGHHNASMQVDFFECLVGGLPSARTFPYQYKAPFSPADVVEEYLRPARLYESGKIVTKPALSEPEYVEFADLGTLESFNTDGLRTLLYTMSHIPDMREKTLRYPGHRDQMLALRSAGFLSDEKIEVMGVEISPREFTSKILFDSWKLGDNEDEFTVMRVTVKGEGQTHVWDLLDRTDHQTHTSSMSRTTGYTCCAMVESVLSYKWKQAGVSPGEIVGGDAKIFADILEFLGERNICLKHHKSF
jgi:lysine 6-dehydrogenase